DERRRQPASVEQVRAAPPDPAVAACVLERTALPARVPARVFRNELSAAALPERESGPARRLLHARLQPGVDQPGRFLVDGDAARSREDRAPRRADADVE